MLFLAEHGHRKIDFGRFFNGLGRQGGSYVVSLNGEGKVVVPESLYDECIPIRGEERIYVRRAAAGSNSHLRR
jgi:hypothetical protein